MKLGIQAAVIDADGTLLLNNGTVSSRTVRSLLRWHEGGRFTLIASARPARSLEFLFKLPGIDCVVCANGATVYDVATKSLKVMCGISEETTRDVIRSIRDKFPTAIFALEMPNMVIRDSTYFQKNPAPPQSELVGDALTLLEGEAVKILVKKNAETVSEHAFYDFFHSVCEIVHTIATPTHSTLEFVEIMACGIDKASTAEWVMSQRGIKPESVVAFGDMPNDIELLRWSGFGVAMGNSGSDVQAAADRVCASNDDDGVAQTLEEILHAEV